MIHFILFVLLIVTACNPSVDDPLPHFLEQLELDRSDVYMDRVVLQEVADDSGTIAAVIPVLREKTDDYFVLDAYVLLADRESGNIEARFFEERAWTSDAYVLEGIEIESEPYQIGPDARAIGVILHYQSSSRVNRVESRELSLFVESNGDLKRVLKDYYVMSSGVIIDGECDSSNSFRSRSMEVSDQRTNHFIDLKILEKEERSVITPESCTDPIVTKEEREFYLKFRDGRYQQVHE